MLSVPDNLAALAAARRKTFDLIVTSDRTSGKEDVELLRQIRRVRPHTRLIILAAEGTPSDVISSMREHAFSYFSKPFPSDTLAEMIRLATEEPGWDDGIEVISGTPELIRIRVRCDLKTADRIGAISQRTLRTSRPGKESGGHGLSRDASECDRAWRTP